MNAITILFNIKCCMHRCKISIIWSTVPVIKMFLKVQHGLQNILTILYKHRLQLRMVSANPRVSETVPRCSALRVCCKKSLTPWYIRMKHSTSEANLFSRSVLSLAVSSKPCFPEKIDCSVSNIRIKSSTINVDTQLPTCQLLSCVRLWQCPAIPPTQMLSNICYLLLCSSLVKCFN